MVEFNSINHFALNGLANYNDSTTASCSIFSFAVSSTRSWISLHSSPFVETVFSSSSAFGVRENVKQYDSVLRATMQSPSPHTANTRPKWHGRRCFFFFCFKGFVFAFFLVRFFLVIQVNKGNFVRTAQTLKNIGYRGSRWGPSHILHHSNALRVCGVCVGERIAYTFWFSFTEGYANRLIRLIARVTSTFNNLLGSIASAAKPRVSNTTYTPIRLVDILHCNKLQLLCVPLGRLTHSLTLHTTMYIYEWISALIAIQRL